MSDWPVEPDPASLATAAEREEAEGVHALIVGGGASSVLLTARSAKPDDSLKGIYKQIKAAAKNQLTGARPGLLFVMIEEVPSTAWAGLAHDSGLRRMTETLFVDQRFSHVHSVLYSSEGLVVAGPGALWKHGPQLIFPRQYGTTGTSFVVSRCSKPRWRSRQPDSRVVPPWAGQSRTEGGAGHDRE